MIEYALSCRNLAEELRVLAEQMQLAENRFALFRVADGLDRVADKILGQLACDPEREQLQRSA